MSAIIDRIISISGDLLLSFPSLNECLLNYRKSSLRIVYYHMVSEKEHEYYFHNKKISPQLFKEQIQYLKKHFEIISLDEAVLLAKGNKSLEKKMVITFDDGFKENHSIIAPILVDEKVTATFYLISNCINNKSLMWRNKLLVLHNIMPNKGKGLTDQFKLKYRIPELRSNEDLLLWSDRVWEMNKKDEYSDYLWKLSGLPDLNEYLSTKLPYLTSNEIREMVNSGFGFGSHSMTHPVFSKLNYDEFKAEITDSIKVIKEITQKDINSFTYPFGIRAEINYEKQLSKDMQNNEFKLISSKNDLNNTENGTIWKRDNLEFQMNTMLFRFSILPIIRNLRQIKQ